MAVAAPFPRPPMSANNSLTPTPSENIQISVSSTTTTATNPNTQFIEGEQKYHHQANPGKKLQPTRPERRGRSPRRRPQATVIPTQEQPAIEIQLDQQPQQQHEELFLPINDRTRSRSPMWVPGSTSYAEVLRGLELERLKAEQLAAQPAQGRTDLTIQDVVDASTVVTGGIYVTEPAPEPIKETQHQPQLEQYITETSTELDYSSTQQPQLQQPQQQQQTSLSNYEVPMTAEEIAATYLQPDPQLYQTMYENVADSGQWSYVTGSATDPQQQQQTQPNYYEQIMQMQYPIQYQQVAVPPATTQYQLLAGYYQPVAQAEPYSAVYSADPNQIYYAQQPAEYSQEYLQQQQQQNEPLHEYQQDTVGQTYLIDSYDIENTTLASATGNSVLDRVVTTLASMVQQSASEPLTTSTQQIQSTVVPSEPYYIEEHVHMLRPVEPQEFEVDEPRPDITFGQFDVDAIETIPLDEPKVSQIEPQPQIKAQTTTTSYVTETTIVSEQTQPTVIMQQTQEVVAIPDVPKIPEVPKTVTVHPRPQRQNNNEVRQQDISTGSTYAEVLFGLHHSQHPVFQPSSQQPTPVRLTSSPPLQRKQEQTTITTSTFTNKSNQHARHVEKSPTWERKFENVDTRTSRTKRVRHEPQPEPLPIKQSTRKDGKTGKKSQSPDRNGVALVETKVVVDAPAPIPIVEETVKPEPKPRKSKKPKNSEAIIPIVEKKDEPAAANLVPSKKDKKLAQPVVEKKETVVETTVITKSVEPAVEIIQPGESAPAHPKKEKKQKPVKEKEAPKPEVIVAEVAPVAPTRKEKKQVKTVVQETVSIPSNDPIVKKESSKLVVIEPKSEVESKKPQAPLEAVEKTVEKEIVQTTVVEDVE
ncbi:titin-like [Drosophila eugracilis]|uniref:titin-like n=1 Tax=Drosophila eugracilis TaxID=29029 RepID=UPI001BDA5CB9|nr:titin-like [Drosophila eugracilis]